MNVAAAPAWNLKTEVTDPSGTTPDEQKGMYSQRVSAYGSYKLREVVRSIVSLRNANASDEEKKFRLFINDGSLPFGGSFSPHQTHNNGNVLDIRPLGNQGETANHYDFAKGQKRLEDIAALWAESTHRYLSCRHIPEEDEARETCETTMRAQFVAAFDAINTRNFATRESELKRWIELNQQLKSLPSPNKFYFIFSTGYTLWSDLCDQMLEHIRDASGEQYERISTCRARVDGRIASELDLAFNYDILTGVLPNAERLDDLDVEIGASVIESIGRVLNKPESGHFDHFHIGVD